MKNAISKFILFLPLIIFCQAVEPIYIALNGDITDSNVKGEKAVVVVQSRISTAAGDANQKEIYYLVKSGEKWLVNELVVTDEEIDLDKIEL